MSRRGDGSGFVRMPVEEHVVKCTVDGDRVSPSWMAEAGERVVRCRDCYWCRDSVAWPGAFECDYINRGVEPDGFCSWGERRADHD